MAAPGREVDLPTLARHLVRHGPVKTLRTPRRVRLLFNGACIADTVAAIFVWEHEYYPQFYLPKDSLSRKVNGYNITFEDQDDVKDENNKSIATTLKVKVQREVDGQTKESSDGFMAFASDLDGKAEILRDMIKVHFSVADQWFEEDTPIFVHPKDPFKRVDILQSTRGLRITVDGKTVAETTTSMHLYETGLPVRYYMPLTAVDMSVLRPSKTRTQCPYKGEAEYYNVVVDGKEHKDIVWFYTRPTIECAAIAGLCCFYNEKVDISIQNGEQWQELTRAKSVFS